MIRSVKIPVSAFGEDNPNEAWQCGQVVRLARGISRGNRRVAMRLRCTVESKANIAFGCPCVRHAIADRTALVKRHAHSALETPGTVLVTSASEISTDRGRRSEKSSKNY